MIKIKDKSVGSVTQILHRSTDQMLWAAVIGVLCMILYNLVTVYGFVPTNSILAHGLKFDSVVAAVYVGYQTIIIMYCIILITNEEAKRIKQQYSKDQD